MVKELALHFFIDKLATNCLNYKHYAIVSGTVLEIFSIQEDHRLNDTVVSGLKMQSCCIVVNPI